MASARIPALLLDAARLYGMRTLRIAGIVASAALIAAAMMPQTPHRIEFRNAAGGSGVSFRLDNSATPQKHQPETMIAGVALLDYNNDGLLDIYFVNGAKLPEMDKSDPKYWNRLYRNNGDGTFTDVTEKAGVRGEGYGMGVAAADYDNDGCEDLYIAGVNRNQLFHNNCDGTFTDLTQKAGASGIARGWGKLFSIGAGWFDYDNDGFLDLYVVNYIRWDPKHEPACVSQGVRAYCTPNAYQGEPGILYHNNGDGTFTDVSDRSGIGKYIGKGMAATFADYDGDGYTDVFVSNDTYRNFLFHNLKNGTFEEVGVTAGVAYNENGKSIAGMGSDFRDYDNDGRPDIFVVGVIGDTFPLFRNSGAGFIDATSVSGVARSTSKITAWGAGMYDFDNDGWKDLFASGGSVLDNAEILDRLPSKLPNLVMRNVEGRRFEDASAGAGPAFAEPRAHRGAAFGDLDNDGKVDIVVTSLNDTPEIWMNQAREPNHWLTLKLIGTKSNRDGIGARVKVTPAGGAPLYNHATTSVGYASSSDPRVHFGLGSATEVESIEVHWPSGARQTIRNVRADQLLTVKEPGSSPAGHVAGRAGRPDRSTHRVPR